MQELTIVGAGLAGSEAAWQALRRGLAVRLYEMRPAKLTPAHTGGGFAELVCSNSLRAANLENAVGLLKEEMRRLDSLIMAAADATRVPAGGALAVDRALFSAYIEQALRSHPHCTVIEQEVTALPAETAVIAAGPLVSPPLAAEIARLAGAAQLYFHDAIAPIISAESIDLNTAFFASRYDKGEAADYLNCPMDEQQYQAFYQAICAAKLHPLHEFEAAEAVPEAEKTFAGCQPIEHLARLGRETMRFGPLKPVGIRLPGGGEAHAIVQLRKENRAATMYNLVGFQTRLQRGEQQRVFRLIPGLEQAEFLRYGQMHRNTYLNAPRLLGADLRFLPQPNLFFAGQITGVEGYLESAACGLAAGINASLSLAGQPGLLFPAETALGGLLAYLRTPTADFQPMNINFGLLPPLAQRIRNKRDKNAALAARALAALEQFRLAHPEAFA